MAYYGLYHIVMTIMNSDMGIITKKSDKQQNLWMHVCIEKTNLQMIVSWSRNQLANPPVVSHIAIGNGLLGCFAIFEAVSHGAK